MFIKKFGQLNKNSVAEAGGKGASLGEMTRVGITVPPVTQDPNQMIIEAGFGLGEAIVSGQITPDSYVVDKSDMSILDINFGTQERQLNIFYENCNNIRQP